MKADKKFLSRLLFDNFHPSSLILPPVLPTNDPAALSHEDILAREQAVARRRRLRWVLGTILALSLAAALGFGVKPALHAVKAWQARRLAAEGRSLMDQEKWLEARQKITDAFTLWPQEPEAVRVTADFLTRVNNPRQALSFWQRLEELHALTPDDERQFATAELGSGNLEAAEVHLARAWPKGASGTRADWQVAMQLAARREHAAEAADFARRILADPAAPERQRLGAAAILLSATTGEAQRPGWQAIETLAAGDKSLESLDALMALTRLAASGQAAASPAAPTLPPLPDLIARIEAHPAAKIQQRLYAVDLRMAQDPARRAELIQGAIERHGATRNDPELAGLAGWLYSRGEYEKVLAVLPPDRAASDRALFFQRLDALGALGRWADIRESIQSRKFPVEPMVAQMYLARCAEQLGESAVRDASWESALAAAGADPGKLVMLAQYAAKNGAVATAGKASRAAVAGAPDSREANEALFQWLEATGQARALRDALIAFAAHDAQNRAVRNDIAYFDALLGVDARGARDTARALLRIEPGSLPHRTTLALAELRLGNGQAALDVFRGITLPRPANMQPRQRAVYAAALWETSYERDAREMVRDLVPEQLMPEERTLIQPILDHPAS